jgi:hypothetical protein
MTAWRCLLSEMAEQGGKDVQITRIPGRCRDNSTNSARDYLLAKGLIVRSEGHKHSMTEAGWLLQRGVIGMYPHKGQRGVNRHELHLAIKEAVSDAIIEHALMQCGFVPGDPITPEVLRRYSNLLISEARATA